jgi:hypothetical protein
MGGGWNDGIGCETGGMSVMGGGCISGDCIGGIGCEACGMLAMGGGCMGKAPRAGANDGGVIRFPNDEVPPNDIGEPCRAGALGIIVMPGTLTPDALPPPRSAAIKLD